MVVRAIGQNLKTENKGQSTKYQERRFLKFTAAESTWRRMSKLRYSLWEVASAVKPL